MAKVQLIALLKKNNGDLLGAEIVSGNKDSFSEAKAEIQVTVDARTAAAQANADEYVAAQAAFNS